MEEPMKYKLTLPIMYARNGQSMEMRPREVIRHRVDGMPPEERALVWHPPHRGWCFKRIREEEEGDWVGNYDTAEEALAALQDEVNSEV